MCPTEWSWESRAPALSTLEGRREVGIVGPQEWGCAWGIHHCTGTTVWCSLDICSFAPVRESFDLILNQKKGRPFACDHGELVELGFERGAVSSKALALGEKGGLGGSHNPVTCLNHEKWRGAYSYWTPSPTLRPGRKPGFLLVCSP